MFPVMSDSLQERVTTWQSLSTSQDEFVARLLGDCANLEEEVAQVEAQPSPAAQDPTNEVTADERVEQDLRKMEQDSREWGLREQVDSYAAINEELERQELDRYDEIEARSARLTRAHELAAGARPLPTAMGKPAKEAFVGKSYVLCLINGSNALFNFGPVSQGRNGGEDVAGRLRWEIEKDLRVHDPEYVKGESGNVDILTFFLYDKSAVVKYLLGSATIASAETWDGFLGGFGSVPNNQCIDVAGGSEDGLAMLLRTLGNAACVKHIYVAGAELDRLYAACPALLPGDDTFYVDVGPKIVLVNTSEGDDEHGLLATSEWRVTTFPRFFGACRKSQAREPSPGAEPMPATSAPARPAVKPIAAFLRPTGQPVTAWLPHDERPVAAAEDADLATFYAGLTTPQSKHKFSPTARLLQQDPQICVWHYFSKDGCSVNGCIRSHQYDLTSRGRRVLKKEISTIRCKEQLRTGYCSWEERNGVRQWPTSMFKDVFSADRPRLHRQRPSLQPLLPSLHDSLTPHKGSGPTRWTKVVVVVVGIYWFLRLLNGVAPQEVARSITLALRGDSCEAEGLVSPASPRREDQHRIVVRVRPNAEDEPRARNPDNTILSSAFHPTLSAQHHPIFDGVAAVLPLDTTHPKKCITPVTQHLPLHPPPRASSPHGHAHSFGRAPELFFSVCTTPQRAVKYSSVWRHFMSAPSGVPSSTSSPGAGRRASPARPHVAARQPTPSAPGCLVTDAQGHGDGKGMALANAEFRRKGLACTMRESSRVGQRYEMRVLGLIRDAWVESERRRWQDGSAIVEWFVFGDDDTWFSDQEMLKDMLSAYDWREDWFLGSFSETVGNFNTFGKIGFGGAGIVLSRALVRKMQPYVDECAERFAHIFGGDGLISHCAAWAREIPLEQLVEEVPALRQMDIRGDATGYLTAGTAPFLTLHHWAGWLDLIPGVDGLKAIQLFSDATSAIGGRNFLRRWVFDGGLVVFTAGHSITFHREATSPEDLSRVEWTWQHHEPRRASRQGLHEFDDKLTYYLSAVERLSPEVALLRHTCSHPSVQGGLREIDVLWDLRANEPSWRDRWLPGWNAARPSPRARAGLAGRHAPGTEQVRRADGGDGVPVEGGEQRVQEQQQKREVKFSG
ncbi:hypothetical protein JCM3770_001046 [Rhodotorula araucariae]